MNNSKKFLSLVVFVGASWSDFAMACIGEPSVAKLRNNVRIIARAQDGLWLEGKHGVPELISVEPLQNTKVSLKIVGQATRAKDSRSLLERMSNDVPKYETFLIPKTLELIPENSSEDQLRYKVEVKDGRELLKIELLFEGGMQKTLRRGCGGGKAQIEPL
jgi:hypothetical protein